MARLVFREGSIGYKAPYTAKLGTRQVDYHCLGRMGVTLTLLKGEAIVNSPSTRQAPRPREDKGNRGLFCASLQGGKSPLVRSTRFPQTCNWLDKVPVRSGLLRTQRSSEGQKKKKEGKREKKRKRISVLVHATEERHLVVVDLSLFACCFHSLFCVLERLSDVRFRARRCVGLVGEKRGSGNGEFKLSDLHPSASE